MNETTIKFRYWVLSERTVSELQQRLDYMVDTENWQLDKYNVAIGVTFTIYSAVMKKPIGNQDK
jgi:hypothetical protein